MVDGFLPCDGTVFHKAFPVPPKLARRNYHVRGGIQNIPDWCRHLYNSWGSAKHSRWYDYHVQWVSVPSFTYLDERGQFSHAFIWSRVRDLWRFARWISERNSECASNFVPVLGKVLRRPSQWLNKPSGTKSSLPILGWTLGYVCMYLHWLVIRQWLTQRVCDCWTQHKSNGDARPRGFY
jgi:hypothetical protein